ncbi:hypothetical protein DY023_06065 [Microbacterium bovistercoris]|uniref:Uncharacterized protein n=1 Tax=Microbacterium bovistercoris TaxID=2293570 RepID=A0A371NVK1_9MICO|nr:hypothetical protein DY023_06065 [Microbacterium bovistercoris]
MVGSAGSASGFVGCVSVGVGDCSDVGGGAPVLVLVGEGVPHPDSAAGSAIASANAPSSTPRCFFIILVIAHPPSQRPAR